VELNSKIAIFRQMVNQGNIYKKNFSIYPYPIMCPSSIYTQKVSKLCVAYGRAGVRHSLTYTPYAIIGWEIVLLYLTTWPWVCEFRPYLGVYAMGFPVLVTNRLLKS